MPPEVHSVLGASAADRWMNCTPSAQLTAGMEDEATTFAAEGTAAHAAMQRYLLISTRLTQMEIRVSRVDLATSRRSEMVRA